MRKGSGIGGYVFETPLGFCAVAYSPDGIVRVVIPERTAGRAEAALRRHVPGVGFGTGVPPEVRKTARRIAGHLAGKPDAMQDVALDLSGFGGFSAKVYRALRRVRPGQTVTYGDLARSAGSPKAARAVGRAMASNPLPLLIPCHRVVGSDGRLTGFSAVGGVGLKARLLQLEGARGEWTR